METRIDFLRDPHDPALVLPIIAIDGEHVATLEAVRYAAAVAEFGEDAVSARMLTGAEAERALAALGRIRARRDLPGIGDA